MYAVYKLYVVMKVISGGGVHLPSKFSHAPLTNS